MGGEEDAETAAVALPPPLWPLHEGMHCHGYALKLSTHSQTFC